MQLYKSESISILTQSLQNIENLETCSFSGRTVQSTEWGSVICVHIFLKTSNLEQDSISFTYCQHTLLIMLKFPQYF